MSVRVTKLINDPADIVSEMLEGYSAAHPDVIQLRDGLIVRTHPKPEGRVGLVIGNGSGHEPAMIGWVGHGLFDVNVPGPIFTAPGPAKLFKGIRAANRGAGVLLCVSNHAGDVLNAELALEFAADEGVEDVEMVLLYDDIASAPKGNDSERRGAAGLFFVWKMVGAYAEAGASLSQCKLMAEKIRDNTRTLSATLQSCAHPVTAVPLADIPDRMMVVGVGVHGESSGGMVPVGSADDAIGLMLPRMLEDLPFREGDDVCVLVNDAGAMTVMELSILNGAIHRTLTEHGIGVHASWLGRYATTQDTAGFSISLCRVDSETKQLYDAPAQGAEAVFVGAPERGEVPR